MLNILNLKLGINRLKNLLVSRYIVNGLFATLIHYIVLTFNIEVLDMKLVWAANFIAVFFGVMVSFFGNRYFVFRSIANPFKNQLIKFIWLYTLLAFIHVIFLLLWSDLYGLDYRTGFIIASGVQFILSFLGNKLLVFNL